MPAMSRQASLGRRGSAPTKAWCRERSDRLSCSEPRDGRRPVPCRRVIAALPADYFGFKATGAILGFANALAGVGVAMGPYVGGYIFDITRSYDYMVVMCIIATIAAIVSGLFLPPVVKSRTNR